MADVNEELVRRYFELKGYFVRTNVKYEYRTPKGMGWSDVDLCVLHPITGDAAAVEVKGWHMEAITPSYFRDWPSLLYFTQGEVGSVRRTVRAGGSDKVEIELVRVQPPQVDVMRAGTGGLSADDLVEAGMRALFLGEPLPASVGMLDFMTDTGIERNDLEQAFAQPNEIAEAISRLVVTEGLVGSGRAARVGSFSLGPRVGDRRRVEIEWTDPRVYTNVEPAVRRLVGDWLGGEGA